MRRGRSRVNRDGRALLALALVQALLGGEPVSECCQRGAEPRGVCAVAVSPSS
jgi:hypothetical protein